MGDRNTALKDLILVSILIAASTIIEAGKMLAVNAAGYALPAADAAGLKVIGRSEEAVDNSSGANGDKSVMVRRKKAFLFLNDGTNAVTQAHLFTDVYVKDAQTVSSNGGINSIVAGKCIGIETAGVWVEM